MKTESGKDKMLTLVGIAFLAQCIPWRTAFAVRLPNLVQSDRSRGTTPLDTMAER